MYLCKEFQIVSRANRAGLHEILVGVLQKTCAHEDIEYIVHISLDLSLGETCLLGQAADEVGVTAVVILSLVQ
jgi:hypothetical protein